MWNQQICFSVVFEGPFWVGVLERHQGEALQVSRVVFGSEPSNAEVLDWLHQHFYQVQWGALHPATGRATHQNPKRRQRESQTGQQGPGQYTHQALQADLQHRALQRRQTVRELRQQKAERQWEIRQAKKKQKRLGH